MQQYRGMWGWFGECQRFKPPPSQILAGPCSPRPSAFGNWHHNCLDVLSSNHFLERREVIFLNLRPSGQTTLGLLLQFVEYSIRSLSWSRIASIAHSQSEICQCAVPLLRIGE